MGTKEEDWVEGVFLASTHDYLMIFTTSGQCYWLKVYQIPPAGRTARGKPIVNLLRIDKDKEIASIVRVREFSKDQHLIFATRSGLVKKTSLAEYANVRSTGIIAINIVEGDRLIDVQLTDGSNTVFLGTRGGMAIRFSEDDVRQMGRATRGVRGIRLKEGDEVIGMVVVRHDATLLTVTDHGMGKRSRVDDYRSQRRGGVCTTNFHTGGHYMKNSIRERLAGFRDELSILVDTNLFALRRESLTERDLADRVLHAIQKELND